MPGSVASKASCPLPQHSSLRGRRFRLDRPAVLGRLPRPPRPKYRRRCGRPVAKTGFRGGVPVLKPGRFCVCFYGWQKADEFLAAWRAAGFQPVGHLVWVKSYASKRGFLAGQHEQAYLLAKGPAVRPSRGAAGRFGLGIHQQRLAPYAEAGAVSQAGH